MSDKYSAIWVSHTSISDFLNCPRAYYLKHVYKDPTTGNKIKLMSPPLALGQAVHEVIESLSVLPSSKRFLEPLTAKYDLAWQKVNGKKGGFTSSQMEADYKQRGREMLKRVAQNPGPIGTLAVKIKMNLPYYWLSEEENIILCGKIDWMEYLPDSDSVHIIDFKTGNNSEDPNSLQLPIYLLLATNCQKRPVSQASYWYLARSNELESKDLPDIEEAYEKIIKIGKKVKLARKLERFKCETNGCRNCLPLEDILNHECEFVGNDEYGADIYIKEKPHSEFPESEIL